MIETKFVEYCKTLALSNKARSQNLVIVIRKATQTHKIGGGGGGQVQNRKTILQEARYSVPTQCLNGHWGLTFNICQKFEMSLLKSVTLCNNLAISINILAHETNITHHVTSRELTKII